MQTAGLVLGILAIVGMVVGFFPCLGSLNWLNIPFAAIGLIISIVAVVKVKPGETRGMAIAGIICCSVALVAGLARLLVGGGLL
jgi:hypothetical protein